ncbi:MAG: polymer-forming cytoskeletal protein [Bryobacterales bacterium]
MWGKKDEPEPSPVATPAPPQPVAPRPAPRAAAPPASSAPAPADRSNSSQAQIGKSLHLKGEITGSEDLYIDGEVEGTVELKDNNLTVGPNGNVHAHVQARSITVLGHLRGNVRAGDKVEIRKTGSLEGDLATARIIIEDGAVFRGSIDIVQPGRAEPDRKPAAQAAAPAPAQASASGKDSAAAASPAPQTVSTSAKGSGS